VLTGLSRAGIVSVSVGFDLFSATAYALRVAQKKHDPAPISAEEVLRRMLNTPPKKHAEMIGRKAKPPGKK